MTKKELKKLGFENAIEILQEEVNDITDIDVLKEFIKENIDNDNFFLAMHLLDAIYNSNSPYPEPYYYRYDYTLGTYDTPEELNTIEDLEQFCED